MLHAYMLTQSGIPMLYSSDEVGRLNDYSYKDDPDKAADSRYIHRGAFQWDLAKKRKSKTSVEGQIFQTLSRMEQIRRQESVFDKDCDVYTYDVHDDSILCILRQKGNERFIGIFNFSDSEKLHGCRKKKPSVILLPDRLWSLRMWCFRLMDLCGVRECNLFCGMTLSLISGQNSGSAGNYENILFTSRLIYCSIF